MLQISSQLQKLNINKMKASISFLFLLGIMFSCSSEPKDETTDNSNPSIAKDTIMVGEKLFKFNCIACHHNMADDSLKITNTKRSNIEIKKILSDTVIHNGLSFLTIEEITMIRKYLNRGAQY